jgi:hypothetical protein
MMVACVPERVLCLIEDMCEDLYVGTLAKLDFPLRPCSRHLTKIMMTKWSRVEIFNRPQITFEPCGHSRLSSVTVSVLGMKQRCLLPIGFLMESPYVPLQAQLPLHDSRSMLWIVEQELYPDMLVVTGTTSSASPIVKTVPGLRLFSNYLAANTQYILCTKTKTSELEIKAGIVAHSGTAQSGTAQSGTGQSGTAQSGTGQSGTGQSGTGQSGTTARFEHGLEHGLEYGISIPNIEHDIVTGCFLGESTADHILLGLDWRHIKFYLMVMNNTSHISYPLGNGPSLDNPRESLLLPLEWGVCLIHESPHQILMCAFVSYITRRATDADRSTFLQLCRVRIDPETKTASCTSSWKSHEELDIFMNFDLHPAEYQPFVCIVKSGSLLVCTSSYFTAWFDRRTLSLLAKTTPSHEVPPNVCMLQRFHKCADLAVVTEGIRNSKEKRWSMHTLGGEARHVKGEGVKGE